MSRIISMLLIITLFAVTATAQDTLRLMSYNIRNCRGLDNIVDIRRTADIIKSSNADIIAIQEVDSCTRRSKGIFIADTLARLCNMQIHFSPAIDYDGGKYGLAILSKKKPTHTQRIALPGREERRTLLAVEYPQFIFACTHLSLNEEDRHASLAIIDSIAQQTKKIFIIAGDLNDNPKSQFIKTMLVNWDIISPIEQYTFPADAPTVTIDYIATMHNNAERMKRISSNVIEEPKASDHRPILTTIVIE